MACSIRKSYRPYPVALLKVTITLLAGLITAGCAGSPFGGWSNSHKWAFGMYAGCQVADTLQTSQIKDDPNLVEKNPVYGSEPDGETVAAVKTLTTGLTYYIADEMPRYRTVTLGVSALLCGAVVAHNASLGVGLGF